MTVSVSEGRFDDPESPSAWGLERTPELHGVVARPAHVPMKLHQALEAIRGNSTASAGALTTYVEYQPIDVLLASRLHSRATATLGAASGCQNTGCTFPKSKSTSLAR